MELPFKYIVLCIFRTLNERSLPLNITKTKLANYLSKIIEKSYFTIEEKKELKDNFDFEYEISSLLDKYFEYFENNGDIISFDSEYTDELGNLILDEFGEYDEEFIGNIDIVVEGDTEFLDILGVPIKKELYNYLVNLEKDIEELYNEMCRLDNYVGLTEVDTKTLIKKITQYKIKKVVLLINAKNLLSYYEHHDLMQYGVNVVNRTEDFDDIELLINDDTFDATDILDDVLLKGVFTGDDLYTSSLSESVSQNVLGIRDDTRNSTIKFYVYFLKLLEKEIKNSNELLKDELVTIKYRLVYILDSVYGTAIYAGKDIIYDDDYEENYSFMDRTIRYFANEILMYADERYRNKECDTDNVMVYLNNIVKKLLIETYYKLTNNREVVDMIKENELYGVNSISSGFLRDIVEKHKSKIREV